MWSRGRLLSVAESIASYRGAGNQPRYITGPDGNFAGLFGWADFWELMELQSVIGGQREGEGLKILADGGRIVSKDEYVQFTPVIPGFFDYRFRPGAVKDLFDAGATINLYRIDRIVPHLSVVCRRMEEIIGHMVHMQCFAACGTTPSYAVSHSDKADAIALQMEGRKTWNIPQPGGKPAVIDLKAGEALYLPEGWPHHPVPVGEATLHLTVSVSMRIPLTVELAAA